MRGQIWTKEEDEMIRTLYERRLPVQEIVRRLQKAFKTSRTIKAVINRACTLRRKDARLPLIWGGDCGRNLWTEEKIKMLRTMYKAGNTYWEIANKMSKTLGRRVSRTAVSKHAVKFCKEGERGIRKPNSQDWTPAEDALVYKLYAKGSSIHEISAQVGKRLNRHRSDYAIMNRARTLGLKRTVAVRASAAKAWTKGEVGLLRRIIKLEAEAKEIFNRLLATRSATAILFKKNTMKGEMKE